MSDYTKTTWVAGGAPGISAINLNHIEDGIDTAHDELSAHDHDGVDAPKVPLVNISPTGLSQGDIFFFNGTSVARLAPGDAGQALICKGAGADPVWGSPGGLSANCQSTDLGNGDEVRFFRAVVPAGKSMKIKAASIYPANTANLIVEAYNITDSVSVYSSTSPFVIGDVLATVAAGKEVVFRAKNTTGSDKQYVTAFISFVVE